MLKHNGRTASSDNGMTVIDYGTRERELETMIEDLVFNGWTDGEAVDYVVAENIAETYDWRTEQEWLELLEERSTPKSVVISKVDEEATIENMLNASKQFSIQHLQRMATAKLDYDEFPYYGTRERELEATIEGFIFEQWDGDDEETCCQYVEDNELETNFNWRENKQWVELLMGWL